MKFTHERQMRSARDSRTGETVAREYIEVGLLSTPAPDMQASLGHLVWTDKILEARLLQREQREAVIADGFLDLPGIREVILSQFARIEQEELSIGLDHQRIFDQPKAAFDLLRCGLWEFAEAEALTLLPKDGSATVSLPEIIELLTEKKLFSRGELSGRLAERMGVLSRQIETGLEEILAELKAEPSIDDLLEESGYDSLRTRVEHRLKALSTAILHEAMRFAFAFYRYLLATGLNDLAIEGRGRKEGRDKGGKKGNETNREKGKTTRSRIVSAYKALIPKHFSEMTTDLDAAKAILKYLPEQAMKEKKANGKNGELLDAGTIAYKHIAVARKNGEL